MDKNKQIHKLEEILLICEMNLSGLITEDGKQLPIFCNFFSYLLPVQNDSLIFMSTIGQKKPRSAQCSGFVLFSNFITKFTATSSEKNTSFEFFRNDFTEFTDNFLKK